MPDADVWYSVHVHWCRPRHDHSPHGVRLWTLKKEAGLLFQKDRKRPQEVGKKIERPFRLVMMCLQVIHA